MVGSKWDLGNLVVNLFMVVVMFVLEEVFFIVFVLELEYVFSVIGLILLLISDNIKWCFGFVVLDSVYEYWLFSWLG